jgi:hypothetical protein
VFGGLENREQFSEAPLVRIADGRIAIWPNPFWMLDTQIIVDSLSQFSVRTNPTRQYSWQGQG